MSKIMETNKFENFNLCRKIKNKVLELMSTSTSHGIPNVVRTSHISMRLMWIVCIMLSIGACSYLIIKSVLQFLESEVVTQVRVVHEFKSEFPRILICNANEFTTNYSLEFLLDEKHNFSNYSLSQLDDSSYVATHNKQALRYVSKYFSNERKQKLAYSLNESLLYCQISGRKCDSNDFEWVYNEFHGNCFVFNSGRSLLGEKIPIKSVSEPGQSNGLQIELYVGMVPELEKYSVSGFSGAKIYIGNNSYKSLYEDQQEILIPSNSQTNIGVQRMIVKQLEKPYSDCTVKSDAKFFKKFQELNYRYNRMDCRDLCKQKRIEDKCGCYFPRLVVIYRNNSCSSSDEFKCVDIQFESFDKNEFNEECNQLCPLECDKMIFTTVYSQSNNYVSRFKTNKNIEKNVAKFNIFYDSLSLIEVTEIPSVTIVDLISHIGGSLGLFLGISVLSLLEIFEIFCEIMFICR